MVDTFTEECGTGEGVWQMCNRLHGGNHIIHSEELNRFAVAPTWHSLVVQDKPIPILIEESRCEHLTASRLRTSSVNTALPQMPDLTERKMDRVP
jgi:hypothetical protein